jgi:hypothetical protein
MYSIRLFSADNFTPTQLHGRPYAYPLLHRRLLPVPPNELSLGWLILVMEASQRIFEEHEDFLEQRVRILAFVKSEHLLSSMKNHDHHEKHEAQ